MNDQIALKNDNVDQAEEKIQAARMKTIRCTSGRICFSDPDNLTVQFPAAEHMP